MTYDPLSWKCVCPCLPLLTDEIVLLCFYRWGSRFSLVRELTSHKLHGAVKKKKKRCKEPMSRKMWPRTSPRRQERRLEMEDGEVKRLGGWKLTFWSRRRRGRAWRHVFKFPRMKTDESLQLEKAPLCGWRKILRPHHSGIQIHWRQSCYFPAFRWRKPTTYNEARAQLTSGFSTAYREFDFLNKYNSEPKTL